MQKKEELCWNLYSWHELSKEGLYSLLKLRSEVFVVEQCCPYQDLDNLDDQHMHLIVTNTQEATVAYARVTPPGVKYPTASIGRICTSASLRGEGIGHMLVERAILEAGRLYPDESLTISAQAHLQAFYEQHGFVVSSSIYDEDGIPHVEMVRT